MRHPADRIRDYYQRHPKPKEIEKRKADMPPPEGGIQYGQYAVIQTLGKDGWKTTQYRIWRDGAWHDIIEVAASTQEKLK